jgi:hypothetical protein
MQLSLILLISAGEIAWSKAEDAAITYAYRHSKGTAVDTVYRAIASSGNEIVITFENPNNLQTLTTCSPDFRVVSWHYESKETGYDVDAVRCGDTIKVTGTKGSKPVQKSFVIDGAAWYQPLEFSLVPFLKSGTHECTFWMIRPTDMNTVKMAMRRETLDTVPVNGRREPALRTVLSPSGLAGRFWKATYWYRASDYSFLKSIMPEGITGSSIVIESMGIQRPAR